MGEIKTSMGHRKCYPGKPAHRFGGHIIRFLLQAGPILFFLGFWEVAPGLGWIDPGIFSTPAAILAEMIKLTFSGELINNAIISLFRVLSALVLALVVAIPLGFIIGGWFKTAEMAINPLVNLLSFANPFTLLPVFLVLFGLGELSKIMIIFTVCLWPILFATTSGIKDVDPTLIKTSHSLGLDRAQIFRGVVLPSSLPAIFTGIRTALLMGFLILIGAEMIGASSGLGYMILKACPLHTASFQLEKMWAGIVTVALLGIVLNGVILAIQKRLSAWKEDVVL
jgi:NitT/TauT family transport system permease protein